VIPARFAPVVFGFVLSAMMSFVVSGIATFRTLGLAEGVVGIWLGNWLSSWAVAFPVVLVLAPVARRMVGRITAPPRGR
jgi:hypothetical protein